MLGTRMNAMFRSNSCIFMDNLWTLSMGTITQIPSGKWQAKVRRKGAPTVSHTFDLKSDAEAWAREVEREYQRGNITALRQDAQKVTVREVLDQFLAGPVQQMRSCKSVASRLKVAREKFGCLFLSNVRGVDVAAWRDELLREGLSTQSVVHFLHALSGVFRYAEQELSIDLPSGNPVRKIAKPKLPPARDRRLRPGEYEALQADRPELLAFIILAVETSMRRGEQVAMRWEHVNLGERTVFLPKTKNGSSRSVALSSLAVAMLQTLPRRIDGQVWPWKTPEGFSSAWKRHRAQARKAHILNRLREALVSEGLNADAEIRALVYKHRAPSPRTVSLFKQIDEADPFLVDLRFHDLRHEATSRLFEKGLGVTEVASMTGHKSLSMLMRYTHTDAARLAKKLG